MCPSLGWCELVFRYISLEVGTVYMGQFFVSRLAMLFEFKDTFVCINSVTLIASGCFLCNGSGSSVGSCIFNTGGLTEGLKEYRAGSLAA